MSTKETMAQMQIQAELEKTLAAITSYSQYVNSNSDYGQKLKELQKKIAQEAALLAALA